MVPYPAKVAGRPRGAVRVQIVDSCPTCGPGQLDLSTAAFSRIAAPRSGVAKVAYRSVRDPELGRGLAFRVRQGSSAAWLALQVLDHGNRLRGVELRDGDSSAPAPTPPTAEHVSHRC
ncbi:RlpA-like double-psi beta-barrel domain-containing protein [Nonomuraea sp. NPDC059194]|uniref:RlpA-like double-psi beta-barrel domain-containing protein n=1 Tax=Nonomuraea sp. NPDC059194 TaxID=3346764 RepID=UPI0036C95652